MYDMQVYIVHNVNTFEFDSGIVAGFIKTGL